MRKTTTLLLVLVLSFSFTANVAWSQTSKGQSKLPNILWITCEDMGPHLGCYGDEYATSPNLDRFAKRSLRYLNAWSNAPVCAPARTTIISGLYATSTGSQHMRSQTTLPPHIQMYVVLLRQLGYYCTNNVKQDYNLVAPNGMWHESSRKAHWKNRKPGQPFFAIFNITITHESQIRNKIKKLVHDPKKAPVPKYHPDVYEVRRDWAQYYDRITQMDERVAELLQELEDAGLAENTIVFFYSDHGSGMPRSKRFPYNSGLNVPFIVHVPAAYQHLAPPNYSPGGSTDRLIAFVDLAPTLLSIAGQKAKSYHQGHAFMGKYTAESPPYIFGFRGRMDERFDMIRSVRDKRYIYLRNYHPHKVYGQHVRYMFQTPTTRVWKQMFDMGKLNPAQSAFWQKKPVEELYDLHNDPDEVHNLANSPKHQAILERFRKALKDHIFEVRDLGFLPENEIHSRSKGSTPYEMGHDPKQYPLERIYAMAELASSLKEDAMPKLLEGLNAKDSAVRYWAVMGIYMRGKEAVRQNDDHLRKALNDPAPAVRIVAAEALGVQGEEAHFKPALNVLLELGDPAKNNTFVCNQALYSLDALGKKVAPVLPTIRSWTKNANKGHPRSVYAPRLLESILSRFPKG